MPTYKTPDVYVEEISIFPPSVAEVETAIPAFIGYTKQAKNKNAGDLHLEPFKISSMVEYQEKFGGAPPVNVKSVNLNGDNSVMNYEIEDDYLMYDSLRLYFDNGGGDCYIVSIGDFNKTPVKADFEKGIAAVKKFDEPTLFTFPDATKLSKTDLGNLQQDALAQCEELKDRFVICDVLDKDGIDTDADDFRQNIGSKNLKYGAAYYPDLKANLGRNLKYRDVKGKVKKFSSTVNWKSMTDDTDVQTLIDELNNVVDSALMLESELNTFLQSKSIDTLEEGYEQFITAFKNKVTGGEAASNVRPDFVDAVDYVYEVAHTFLDQPIHDTDISDPVLTYAKNLVTGSVQPEIDRLVAIDNSANSLIHSDFPRWDELTWEYADWNSSFDGTPTNDTPFTTDGSDSDKKIQNMLDIESIVTEVFYSIVSAVKDILEEAHTLEDQKETSLRIQLPPLKNVFTTLNQDSALLPPSGAIAGIYADVDSKRGVWKAPANVSISSVIGFNRKIDHFDQQDLNVDVTAGKSINALRTFTGKGHMVWGARTLAGNDNEWRYVPVRRFFNMVEESVKKSTYWAVFEPNDANTWVKVRTMIENYLTQLWRDGALAGAKPDQAFFVKVGLGLTMTQQDILEGRMKVEIGMAVVRPAEFIILKFSHKMQEA
ncbi:phage tail sheath C-terminal domain-containing protein [Fodinibius salsisoli]|uniref:Phage tail sheath subtilisin-like domain-containing protein n=1 Tax=Fodinibius salsisoli TaxID=2820877 RepID=A0ABT3PQM3_9BACT|nr:phage tail sheath C-terminal domain-containing protein [Fodinibius salsisoli]MCW9708155.1 phage tail sheath subtilisin-like domain-containing protein [Fodinibius salsisoli]